MADTVLVIEHNRPIPKVAGRGRPRGSGVNLRLLSKLAPGDSVFDIPEKKMKSIRMSAYSCVPPIPISVRRIPQTNLYAIFRLK